MQVIPQSSARRIPVAPEFTILEYGPLGGDRTNGTVAEIHGRYPRTGWGMNTESDELVYVVSGTGRIEMPDAQVPLNAGDVAFIEKGQKIACQGEQLVVFIPCIPAWRPEQHVLVDA